MGCIITIVLVVTYLHDNSVDIRLLQLPKGFKASIRGRNIPRARQIAVSPKGIVYVGTCTDSIYSLVVNATDPTRLIGNLTCPAGVAFFENNLYVLQNNSILRYDNIESSSNIPTPAVIWNGLPNSTYPKYIKISRDRKILISIGSNCNDCFPNNTISATIVRMELDGSNFTIVARGVRMSQGFDWDSQGRFWFTDVSKETNMNDYPDNELNRLDSIGSHFGYPYCYGNTLDILESQKNCSLDFIPPIVQISPQVGPFGMASWIPGNFPIDFSNSMFVAEHGSVDQPESLGFRVMHYNITSNTYSVFVDGWLSYNIYFGRPTDVVFAPDGTMLISDDHSGSIYQVIYSP